MILIRRAIFALILMAGLIPAFAQAPPPVPALPDTERRTSYSISGTTCACAVNFALYGDSTDYQDWLEVYLNGVRVNFNDPIFGWAITSPTGSLATIPRPITDAVLTFTNAQTGTVQIVGARRPRRVSQFSENRGVAARDLNQALTDIVAQNRETWDKTNDVTGRALLTQPGNTLGPLPLPSTCAGMNLGFDGTGLNPVCIPGTGGGGGGGGTSSSAFDQAFCNTVGYLIVRFTGAWACSKSIAANPVWWGADPTGVADSTSALNSALAASSRVEFPAGKFKFNSAITYNIPSGFNAVTISGAGQENTILFWPNAAGGITFNYGSVLSSVHMRDLSMTTGVAGGGSAVTLALSTAQIPLASYSDFYRITIRGNDALAGSFYWTNGFNISNVSGVNFDSVAITGGNTSAGYATTSSGIGINIAGLVSPASVAGGFSISKSTFQYVTTGINYGTQTQGVIVDQSNFQGDYIGINVVGGGTNLDQLNVVNSQLNCSNADINILSVVGGSIVGNLFINPANSVGIQQLPNANFTIEGNVFEGSTTTGTLGVVIGSGAAQGSIKGNIFTLYGTGVWLQSSALGLMTVEGNSFVNNTTPVLNQDTATTNMISGNPGYNPVGPFAITVGSFPFTYTAGSSPETVYVRTTGTLTSITIAGGVAIAGAAAASGVPITVELGPNESLTVNGGTGTFTVEKMVH